MSLNTLQCGIEPRSPALGKSEGRLVTGGYTDHYTIRDLLVREMGSLTTCRMRYPHSITKLNHSFLTV